MAFAAALIIFTSTLAWLSTEKTPRHIVIFCAVLMLLLCRVSTLAQALQDVNWHIILLLFGLFTVVEALSMAGFFERIASFFVRYFGGRPMLIFFLLPIVAGTFSMGINNITVMMFMTPLTQDVCRRLQLAPLPLLIGEVCCANMMGAATLIGAPPNLLMAETLGYGFKHVAVHMAPLAFASTGVFLGVHFLQHRDTWGKTPSLKTHDDGMPARKRFRIDFETLIFFIGLFILVGGLERTGFFQTLAHLLGEVRRPVLLMIALLWTSAMASALVDNIPMSLAMAYLIKDLSVLSSAFPAGIMVWAALLGLTLGGNMTPIGASPNVVTYGLLERHGIKIGWKTWMRLTIPATLSALMVSSLLMYVKYRIGCF